jgi:uncharacterized protein YndB with AHSA1/START domain/DNA-binding transcriptional ArsR family regulator
MRSSPSPDVFRALADPSRRHLLDLLRARDGQTLGELAHELSMARQSVTQHLSVLESANLVSSVWQGRRKLHYLNPVPLHEISGRWLRTFDHARLSALDRVRRQAEENDTMNDSSEAEARPDFRYVTYIRATPQSVWQALTDADLTAAYWGHSNVSDWNVGSAWEHRRTDGSGVADVAGTIVQSEPPRRLAMTFAAPGVDSEPDDVPLVTFDIEPFHEIVRLTVTHTHIPSSADWELAAVGWSSVLSNLKTLLETGEVLPQAPWEMHAEIRDARMAASTSR